MTDLSPAAQAVRNAFLSDKGYLEEGEITAGIAAALRAAANEVAAEKKIEDIDYVHQNYTDGYKDALYEILNIADELEQL